MSGTSWAGTSTRYHVLTDGRRDPQAAAEGTGRHRPDDLHHLVPQGRRRQAAEAVRRQAPPAPARAGADAQPARPAAPRRIGQPDAGRARRHRRRQPPTAAPAHRQLRRGHAGRPTTWRPSSAGPDGSTGSSPTTPTTTTCGARPPTRPPPPGRSRGTPPRRRRRPSPRPARKCSSPRSWPSSAATTSSTTRGTAAIGSVFFLARPHPRPDDIGLAIQAVNDWAARMRGTARFDELVRGKEPSLDAAGKEFRHQARAKWRAADPADGLVQARPGREGLVHLGPARGHLAGHRQARARRRPRARRVRGRRRSRSGRPGDSPATRPRPACSPACCTCWPRTATIQVGTEPSASGSPVSALDRVLVTTLYKPLYEALSRLFPAAEADLAAITHLETS